MEPKPTPEQLAICHRLMDVGMSFDEMSRATGYDLEIVKACFNRSNLYNKRGRRPRFLNKDLTITCNKCKRDLPKDAYHIDQAKPLGVAYSCKECVSKSKRRLSSRVDEAIRKAVKRNQNNPTDWLRLEADNLRDKLHVVEVAIEAYEHMGLVQDIDGVWVDIRRDR